MQKYLSILIAILVTVCCSAPVEANPTQAAQLRSVVVALTDHGDPYCSGTWISRNQILTAAHCISSLELEFVTPSDVYPDGSAKPADEPKAHKATLEIFDDEHDIATLSVADPPKHGIARISNAKVLQGQFVQTLSTPMNQWFSYSTGTVAAVRFEELGIDILWIQATVPISPGSSGGGLFNARGDLIGVCSRSIRAPSQGLNFFVHADYVKALLKPGK